MIEINNFQTLEVIVVSRPKRENMKVKATGGSFEPTIDKNVRIIVPPGCFKNETGIHFKVNFGKHQDNDYTKICLFMYMYLYFIISNNTM